MMLAEILLSIALLTATSTAPEELSFPSSDGGVVGAHVYGEGENVLVLVHGGRFNKESWAEQAPFFAEAGFKVLAIDLRGRGISHGGPQEDSERDLQLDVLAAVRFARENGASSVSVIGASLGGWATGQASVEGASGEIDRIVLLAASPIQQPERMQGQKLFIVARGDLTGSGRSRLEITRNQYQRATNPKELVVLDGEAHAQFLFDSEQGEELLVELLRFLTAQSDQEGERE